MNNSTAKLAAESTNDTHFKRRLVALSHFDISETKRINNFLDTNILYECVYHYRLCLNAQVLCNKIINLADSR